ncbi:hypothetical protein BCD48_27400 [Pseudofrankia sp. BMG5.36]|nr:hypothetical protein BCD48_27400 [Pseudofrankia sp. BMG5.36]
MHGVIEAEPAGIATPDRSVSRAATLVIDTSGTRDRSARTASAAAASPRCDASARPCPTVLLAARLASRGHRVRVDD